MAWFTPETREFKNTMVRIIPMKKGEQLLVFDSSTRVKTTVVSGASKKTQYPRVPEYENGGYRLEKIKDTDEYEVPIVVVQKTEDAKVMLQRKKNGDKAIQRWLSDKERVVVPKYSSKNAVRYDTIRSSLIPPKIFEKYIKESPPMEATSVVETKGDMDMEHLQKQLKEAKQMLEDAKEMIEEFALESYKDRIKAIVRQLDNQPRNKDLQAQLSWVLDERKIQWIELKEGDTVSMDIKENEELCEEITTMIRDTLGQMAFENYVENGIIPSWILTY